MPNEIYHRSNWGNANAEGFGDVYFDAAATNKLYNHSDYYENSDGTDATLKDLSNKASIVLTPTAYSDGSLNTVIPPYQVLPTELVTNGTFDTDSDWTKGSGWSISSGTANANSASSSYFYQTINELAVGKTYSITYTITSYTSGSVVTGIGDLLGNRGTTRNAIGTYTDIITFSSNTTNDYFGFFATSSFTGSIDNVSVKEIQEADFDFSRGSSATRVNEQGLIEDSQGDDYPRIDFTDGTGSLLLEPQRTNLITYSEELTTNWTRSGISTPTNADVDAPDGATTVKRLQTNNADGSIAFTYNTTFNQVSGTTYTVSVYAKSFDGTNQLFGIFGNGSGASDSHSGNLTATNEWQRFTYTFTASNTSTVGLCKGNDRLAFDILFWGFQVEQGDYATSYIPTIGSTVTRSADVANNSGNADLFNDSEGVLYAEIKLLQDVPSANMYFGISNGSLANSMFFRFNTLGDIFAYNGGLGSTNIIASKSASEINLTNTFKLALKYGATNSDFSVYINGFEITQSGSFSATVVSGLSKLDFALYDGTSSATYGKVKCVAVFKEALTDAELQQLTS